MRGRSIDVAPARYLEPRGVRFSQEGAELVLTLPGKRPYRKVSILSALPLSGPRRYLSVRDQKGREIGIIRDLGKLDPKNRRFVEGELTRRYLVPVILQIVSVKERFGTVDWTVETNRGRRSFTTRNLRENVIQPSTGRYILSDVDGNRYDVPSLVRLDNHSQGLLLQHL